jgi:hypothetical protein
MNRAGIAAGVAATTFALSATTGTAAAAVKCGATDPKTKEPARAMLTLDESKTETTKALKRSEEEAVLTLVFSFSGCTLEAAEPQPTLLSIPIKGSADIEDALTVRRADADGSFFFLRIQIDPKKTDAGSYDSLVIARAPYLASNSTAVSISESDSNWLKVLGLGALAALAGLLWLLILKAPTVTHDLGGKRLSLLSLIAVAAGIYAAWNNWHSQDLWTSGANLEGLLTAAFAASSAGAVATVISGSK